MSRMILAVLPGTAPGSGPGGRSISNAPPLVVARPPLKVPSRSRSRVGKAPPRCCFRRARFSCPRQSRDHSDAAPVTAMLAYVTDGDRPAPKARSGPLDRLSMGPDDPGAAASLGRIVIWHFMGTRLGLSGVASSFRRAGVQRRGADDFQQRTAKRQPPRRVIRSRIHRDLMRQVDRCSRSGVRSLVRLLSNGSTTDELNDYANEVYGRRLLRFSPCCHRPLAVAPDARLAAPPMHADERSGRQLGGVLENGRSRYDPPGSSRSYALLSGLRRARCCAEKDARVRSPRRQC